MPKALETAIHYGEQTVAAFIATPHCRADYGGRPRLIGRRFEKFAIDTMSCSLPMRSYRFARTGGGLRGTFGVTPDIMTSQKASPAVTALGAVAISASLNQPRWGMRTLFTGLPMATRWLVRLASNCWKSSKMSNCSRIAGNKKRFCSPIRNHC